MGPMGTGTKRFKVLEVVLRGIAKTQTLKTIKMNIDHIPPSIASAKLGSYVLTWKTGTE